MTEEKFDFDIHFQNGILKKMLQDDVFSANCVRYLNPSYFENKYQAWLFKKITQYIEKYKITPTKHFLIDQLKTISVDELDSYKKGLKNILETEIKDVDYMKEELTAFIRNREYKKLHTKCAQLFNDGKFEEAYKTNEDIINSIRNTSFAANSYVRSDDIDAIIARTSAEAGPRNMVPTGIVPLDKHLGGGLYKKTASTLIAAYNVGKTTAAINVAYFAALSGKKVLFLFHEGNKDRLVLKFISRITGIDYNSIITGQFMEGDKEKIEKAKELIDKQIRIQEMRHVGVSIEDVYAYCKQTKKEWDFDLLIDDYAGILNSNANKFKEKRFMISYIWMSLGLMSAELDIAILTIAQFNRDAVKVNRAGKNILRSDDVAECADINHHSENIFTLNRSSNDSLHNELIICLDKARDAQAGFLVRCTTDFRNMRTWCPKLGIYPDGYDDGEKRAVSKPKDM